MAEDKKVSTTKPEAKETPAKKVTKTQTVSTKDVAKTQTTSTKTAAKETPAKKVSKTQTVSTKDVAKTQTTSTKKVAPAKKPATKFNVDLPKEVFGVKINQQAIFDAIMSERASVRQGTHSTKTRAEVSGGGRKPWRQKGTGNARQGSIRSPQWVGGGIVFGPKPNRNYTLKVNKKVKKLAFKSAYTLKAKSNAITINDFKIEKPSTKSLIEQLTSLNLSDEFKKVLIITSNPIVWKSASNLEKVFATKLSNLTVESIINADLLIFEKQAMETLTGKAGK